MAQFLTENLLLATVGAVLGLGLAWAGMKALIAVGPEYIPRVDTVTIDGWVGLFLLGITVLTALAFGLIPAMQAAGGNLSDALKEGGRGGSDGVRHGQLRSVLVASEFALAFVLLIGAGLMIRSFIALESVDPGFQTHNILSMIVSVAGTKEEAGNRRPIFYHDLLEKVTQLPGVTAASAINHLPLAGDLWSRSFEIQGRPKPLPTEEPEAVYRVVMPRYFETMRLPVRRGRAIAERDNEHAPGVVMVNERAVREYWRGANPVGQRITLLDENKAAAWLTVIGVVADAKQERWAEEIYPEVYVPALQNASFLGESDDPLAAHMNYLTLVMRSAVRPEDLATTVKRTVWSFDRNLPISDVLTMDRVVADATAQPRFEMLLLAAFGAVALLLAAVGIYGVLSYAVARRTREIGIRISLGASRADVLRMVAMQALWQALVGSAVGVAGAGLLSKLMTRMLYGVQPTDPTTFAGVAVVLGAVAVIAMCIPARRATRIEPMVALRSE
jgi:predicted permease